MPSATRSTARNLIRTMVLLAGTWASSASSHVLSTFSVRISSANNSHRTIHGLFAHPDGGRTRVPTVLVLNDEAGLDGRSASLAAWLNEQGWATLEADLTPHEYDPQPPPSATKDQGRDVFSLLRALSGNPGIDPDRIAVVGLGRGGRAALHTLTEAALANGGPNGRPRFAAHAALYPGCRELKAEGFAMPAGAGPPVLLLAAGADASDAAPNCVAFNSSAANPGLTLHVYAEAAYGWDATEMAGGAGPIRLPVEGRGFVVMRADKAVMADADERLLTLLRNAFTRRPTVLPKAANPGRAR